MNVLTSRIIQVMPELENGIMHGLSAEAYASNYEVSKSRDCPWTTCNSSFSQVDAHILILIMKSLYQRQGINSFSRKSREKFVQEREMKRSRRGFVWNGRNYLTKNKSAMRL